MLKDKLDTVDGQVKEVANETEAQGKILETGQKLFAVFGDHIQDLDQVASRLGFGLGLGLELGLGLLQAKQHLTTLILTLTLTLCLPLPLAPPLPRP